MSESRARATKKATPARRQPQDRKLSLREQLAKKRAKTAEAHFPLGEEGERAVAELEKLRHNLMIHEIIEAKEGKGESGKLAELRAKIAKVEATRDAHCLILRVRGLSEDEHDALVNEYGPDDPAENATDEEKKQLLKHNTARMHEWTYAALAVCALDSDLTAEEWRDELTSGRWTVGDVMRIREAIQEAYTPGPSASIPKG